MKAFNGVRSLGMGGAMTRGAARLAWTGAAAFLAWGGMAWAVPGERSPEGAWTEIRADELDAKRAPNSKPWVRPDAFAAFEVNAQTLEQELSRAPMEFTDAARAANPPAALHLPSPEGGFERFAVMESPIMAPELAQWMADQGRPMKTFKVWSLDAPATTGRIDFGGPSGFHAMIQTTEGDYFVDPYWQGDDRLHAAYWRDDYPRTGKDFVCDVIGQSLPWSAADLAAVERGAVNSLRTYRLANAATGEYTAFHGGTQIAGQAAIVTSINRVNQIYERDLSTRMILVANNQNLVYTNAGSDPYSNNDGFSMLGENQSNCNSVIGSGNYDIGHVFSTGGGGVAQLQCVCTSNKAEGVTGQSSPIGDPFDIDYVAHEMGHQFGGNHCFNSSSGSCSGNRNGSTAYERGSGVTIQAYAGICGSDNIASNSIAMFHRVSLNEMLAFINSTSCDNEVASGNTSAPVVNAGANYTIPRSTPFELTPVSASDANGDSITYCWEEFDLGPSNTVASGDNGSSPIFRDWLPTTAPNRVFPQLTSLVNNTTPFGETLPTTSRTMTFFLTVRDNNPGGGLTGSDSMTVTSTTSAGPFQVTAPNGGGTLSGSTTVTWNVASTSSAPVNAANVDIYLSTDGGLTYPTTLATATPNDGSATVVLPNITTSTARVRVQGSGNIFFDISNANFSITPGSPEPLFESSGSNVASDSAGNNNGAIDPGETIALTLGVSNVGTQAATAVSATLTSMTGTVSVTQGSSAYPNLPSLGGTGNNTTPFSILVDSGHPCGDAINLRLTVTSVEKTNFFDISLATGTANLATLLNEGFEAASLPSGWSSSADSGANKWAPRTDAASAGTVHAGTRLVSFEPPDADVVDSRLVTPSLTGATELSFFHAYDMEQDDSTNAFDGLVIEVSTNGGSSWTPLETEITSGGYTHGADGGFGSPLAAGRQCWSGQSAGFPTMSEVTVDLSAYSSQTIRLGFRYTEDNCCSESFDGWFIDDVVVTGASITCDPFTGGVPPVVSSISRQTPSTMLTNAASVTFRVQFGEAVSGLDTVGPTFSNFTLSPSGLGGTPAISAVAAVGASPSAQWDVTVGGYSGEGTLGLSLSGAGSIISGSTGLGLSTSNLPLAGQTYTIDRVAPTATTITPATVGPTNAASVSFSVTFSESVTGFDAASDATVTHLGTANSGVTVSGSGSSYTANVTGLSGEGTFTLRANTGSGVTDAAGNAVSSSVTSAAVALDRIAPQMTAAQVQTELQVDVTFNEQMGAGVLTAGNYAISGSGRGTLATNPNSVAQIARRTGAPSTYRLTWLSGDMVFGGDITITATGVQDSVTNPIGANNFSTHVGGALPVELSAFGLE
jgi:hypothetical protein